MVNRTNQLAHNAKLLENFAHALDQHIVALTREPALPSTMTEQTRGWVKYTLGALLEDIAERSFADLQRREKP